MDLTSQLYKVIDWANRNGCPDAADFIRDRMTRRAVEAEAGCEQARNKLLWIKRYRAENGCTLKVAVDAYNAEFPDMAIKLSSPIAF